MSILRYIQSLFSGYNYMVIPASLLAIILHEIAHGYMAYWLGDITAKQDGRLSLNPLKHVDWIGLIMLIFFRVGWAKPVRVDIRHFKHPKRDFALVSFAGPLMNFVLAFISVFFVFVLTSLNIVNDIVNAFFSDMIIVNLGLGIFNLIPIPPLDGSKILEAFLPDRYYYKVLRYERYGFILLILVVYSGILNSARSTVIYWCIYGFVRFWGFLFGNSTALSVFMSILS